MKGRCEMCKIEAVNKKLTYQEIESLPYGTKVYIIDTCIYPKYSDTSGYRIKIANDNSNPKEDYDWGLKRLDDSLFFTNKSVLDGRIEVYSIE
jgi:hypothetical protein